MMGRSLLIVGLMGTLGVIATAVLGYLHGPIPRHVLMGLAASLLVLFAHCWIMFYLIGTGKAIKDAVKEGGLDPAFAEETKRFKNASYPSMMLAMGLVMATFIVGGGVHNQSIPNWVHDSLFYAAVVVQCWSLWIEWRVLTDNERLMTEVDRRLAAGAKAAPAL